MTSGRGNVHDHSLITMSLLSPGNLPVERETKKRGKGPAMKKKSQCRRKGRGMDRVGCPKRGGEDIEAPPTHGKKNWGSLSKDENAAKNEEKGKAFNSQFEMPRKTKGSIFLPSLGITVFAMTRRGPEEKGNLVE